MCIRDRLEFLDKGSLNLIRSHSPEILPDDSAAMLMIEVDGSSREVNEASIAILSACQNEGLLQAERVTDTENLWQIRKALSPLLKDIAPKKINEDVVVPVSTLPEFLNGLTKLSLQHQISNVNFGHAGNGNIHVNLLVDPDNTKEMDRATRCLNQIFDLVISLNGTLSGEHGIGREKRAYIDKEIDPTTMNLMKNIKQVFDPNNILNPGKLFLRDS